MSPRINLHCLPDRERVVFFLWATITCVLAAAACHGDEPKQLRGVLVAASELTEETFRELSRDQFNTIVLEVRGQDGRPTEAEVRAVNRIQNRGIELNYWLEIARNETLANAHPEWMASLQGHQQWRRLHPDFPTAAREKREVIKNYPWVPILYQEAFEAHLKRVESLLTALPAARRVLLNDLQGAPSACGCGNILCRWTADYGPIKTATSKGDTAASEFVAAVSKLTPKSQVIPVWVTECEQHDGVGHGACAGVGCFDGICWKAYTRQLMSVVSSSEKIGVLLPLRDFQRQLPVFKEPAQWTQHALRTFQSMPPQRGGKAVQSQRLIAILQGWQVDKATVAAQIKQANSAGVRDYVIAVSKIEQQWAPKRFTPAR